MKAIRFHRYGGPDVLQYEDVETRNPGPGEIRIRNHAIGVNFIDIYMRTGAYPVPQFPFSPGKEGAGEVIAVGDGVSEFAIGDRVAYVEAPGAYSEEHNVPASVAVHLPITISYETAASMMLKGLTAQYLLRRTYMVTSDDVVLIHAAAGGVGQIATQWAKYLGATVIGTVGSRQKAELARLNGCDYVIDYSQEDLVARVRDITGNKGCDVVYDGIGKATFPASLDCLRPFGYFVSFGTASGPIPPFDIMMLAAKGSLFTTWPLLPTHIAKRENLIAMSNDLFDVVAKGAVKIPTPNRVELADAALAHHRLETRQTTGATILLP
ncbi:quinone oxidoreductase [Thalassospira sp.]|uniref:quinone oxidoreductase family protein n=1 Tax=Thalassospira sp. TaxID=1912094 RepID=UPI0032F0577A